MKKLIFLIISLFEGYLKFNTIMLAIDKDNQKEFCIKGVLFICFFSVLCFRQRREIPPWVGSQPKGFRGLPSTVRVIQPKHPGNWEREGSTCPRHRDVGKWGNQI
jgi:hypothetical protein